MSLTQLDVLLAKSVIVCEAARSNYEYDLLERTCRTLEKLSGQHLSKLIKLARSENPGRRARAVFALAFSRRPQDLDLVQKAARDKSPEVRAMALAGLAVRRHPGASVELLILMLDDEVPAIRRRACQAVAACLSPEHYSVVGAIEKLDRLMIHDQSSGVRREAVRALAAVGGPAEIAKLEKALTHELDVEIREEIHAAIDRLRAGNG
jgi:HEAT repeat protein